MFKSGRGGGGRRPGMTAPPPPRPGGGAPLGRGPISAAARGRGRGTTAAASAPPPVREETFSLESGGPPDFASIIRLAPDLLDEIRRCEARGGTARIKFGSNTLNTSENVIEVGLKEYNFTWSAEFGVCDIYEVCRNGEDGNGLLLERGSALRKMNVQRILDESAKNQVKMRSVQAELQSKSRKSIILDPANPSVQKQVKSMAAAGVEGSMRRWGPKDKFFKKPNQAPIAAPPKTITKVIQQPPTNLSKNAPSVSPAPSPPQHSFKGTGMELTVETIKEDIMPQNYHSNESKKNDKGASKGSGNGFKARKSENSADLRGALINVLSENPKGLSLKALEKALGNSFSDSAKKIETIVKSIAIYQAPGRYILKPALAAENSNWHTSDRSSPDNTPEFHDEIEEALREEENNNTLTKNNKAQQNVAHPVFEEEPMDGERIDIEGGSPLNIDIDINNNNESDGNASSSSDSSDSDSDSDSSDNSGSDRSTRSAAGSGSQSSSQSDDTSSSSDDDDIEVNILSDDEKDTNPTTTTSKIVGADLNLSPFPEHAHGLVDIVSSPVINLNDDDMHNTPVTATGTGLHRRASGEENLEQLLGGLDERFDRPAPRNNFTERKMSLSEERRPGLSVNGKQNPNLKRSSTERLPDAKKRPKIGGPSSNLPVEAISIGQNNKSGLFPERSPNLQHPDRSAEWDVNVNVNVNLDSNYVTTSKEQRGIKNTARRPGNNRSLSNERSSDDNNKPVQKRVRDRTHIDANDGGGAPVKRLRENSGAVPPRNVINGHNSPANMRKVLRREVSELELGEFREPGTPEDEFKRLFGSSSSSKPEDDDDDEDVNVENNKSNNNNANSSAISNKTAPHDNNSNTRSRNFMSASPQQRAAINHYQEAISDLDRDNKSATRVHKSDEEEDGSHNNNNNNNNNKNRISGAYNSKNTVVPQIRPITAQLESNNNNIKQDENNSNGVRPVKKLINKNHINGGMSRNKGLLSSCDDALYLKYNKEQPDMKGPIHDISQFEEYIKEYQEKYPVYLSLNKQLEEYRERYTRMGKEIEAAKGKNRVEHASILEKMREMFRQDKDRHCLLKKVFLILHEELATIKEKLSDFYEEYNQNID